MARWQIARDQGVQVLRTIALVLGAAAIQDAAHAQYKCVTNGQTTYSERPCAPTAKQLDLKVAPVTRSEMLENEARISRQRRAAIDLENSRLRGDAEHATRAQAVQDEAQAKRQRCAELQAAAKQARDDGSKWRYHQGMIDDARRRQKEAEDEHFSNCYGRW